MKRQGPAATLQSFHRLKSATTLSPVLCSTPRPSNLYKHINAVSRPLQCTKAGGRAAGWGYRLGRR